MNHPDSKDLPAFAYPEDMLLADKWRAEGRISPPELEECFRIQRADPPPPRTLASIGKALDIADRFTAAEAVARFEAEAKRSLRRERIVAERDLEAAADYTIVRKMGQGGQAEVFLAQQHSPHRLAILKRLSEEVAYDGKCVLRFLEEAILLERVRSEEVVDLYEYGIAGGRYFIVMEYVVGESLSAYLKRMRRLPIEETIRILLSLTKAFSALSEAGVVHCDVKPSNVMLPLKGISTKLIDFGAGVRVGARQVATGGWLGSPPYMAPEQFRNEELTPRTDVYSLGITCFQMLTGQLPFEPKDPALMARRHINEPLPSLLKLVPDVPVRMTGVLRKMCAKDPKDRYGDFEELRSDLEGVLQKI